MKTNKLTGADLDRAVAKALGMHTLIARGGFPVFDSDAFAEYRNEYNDDKLQRFSPSTDWSQGGPIIEREKITLDVFEDGVWVASEYQEGPTPLIAAMRCYVASKLGDNVDIPEKLS